MGTTEDTQSPSQVSISGGVDTGTKKMEENPCALLLEGASLEDTPDLRPDSDPPLFLLYEPGHLECS